MGIKGAFMLMRVQTAPLSAGMALIGYFAAGGSNNIIGVLLFLQGIIGHAWANSLNEYSDRHIDRKAGYLTHKPLVSGTISDKTALIIVWVLFGLHFPITILVASGMLTYIMYFITVVLLYIYNAHGKKFYGSDYVLALAIFSWYVYGVSAAGSFYFTTALVALGLIAAVQVAFNNSVEGGIKDVESDRKGNARTLAIMAGVKWEDRIYVPLGFNLYAASLKLVQLVLLWVVYTDIGHPVEFVVAAGFLVLAIIVFYLPLKETSSRKDVLKRFTAVEVLSFLAFLVSASSITGPVVPIVLFLTALIWFMFINLIMYGTPSTPGV